MSVPPSVPAKLVAVEVGLQVWGDTVGTLVVLLDPPPTLTVLNADGSDTCRDTRKAQLWAPQGLGTGVLLHSLLGCPHVPPPTCHNSPKLLHQLDGRSHGAPRFNPLVHEEDAHTWQGTEAVSECLVPIPKAPLKKGAPY